MSDAFSSHQHGLDSPAYEGFAVTPHDSTNFSKTTRGLYVGGTGNVVAIMDGTAITFVGVQGGSILPIRCTRVNSTSTTATSIVGLL